MKQSKQEIELNYKASDLYNIVLDIAKYPEYIPWCTKIEITNKSKKNIRANMYVDYKLFPTQIFTSNVMFDEKKLLIKTTYLDGPLKDLDTIWEFKEQKKNKTKILFIVKFEFKNFIHQKIAEIFFPLVEKKMIKSFINRANEQLK